MIHYSCDRCGCPIGKGDSIRYVVKIEMEATLDFSEMDNFDDDQDCLLEMDGMLQKLEQEAACEEEPFIHQRKSFDLCPSCFRKYVKNPIGRERTSPFGFSHN